MGGRSGVPRPPETWCPQCRAWMSDSPVCPEGRSASALGRPVLRRPEGRLGAVVQDLGWGPLQTPAGLCPGGVRSVLLGHSPFAHGGERVGAAVRRGQLALGSLGQDSPSQPGTALLPPRVSADSLPHFLLVCPAQKL